jgi:hypothetical protein
MLPAAATEDKLEVSWSNWHSKEEIPWGGVFPTPLPLTFFLLVLKGLLKRMGKGIREPEEDEEECREAGESLRKGSCKEICCRNNPMQRGVIP